MDRLTRLAVAAGRGDGDALDELVRASYGEVWRLCASLVDAQAADDLAQEVFARAVRGLGSFRAEASARTWLLAIARHVCLDEQRALVRRRRGHRQLAEAERLAPDAGQDVGWSDLLGRLEPDRRSAFVLTQVLGLRYAEAAQVCGCPVGTIRSRVARAREDLAMAVAQAERGGEALAVRRRPAAADGAGGETRTPTPEGTGT